MYWIILSLISFIMHFSLSFRSLYISSSLYISLYISCSPFYRYTFSFSLFYHHFFILFLSLYISFTLFYNTCFFHSFIFITIYNLICNNATHYNCLAYNIEIAFSLTAKYFLILYYNFLLHTAILQNVQSHSFSYIYKFTHSISMCSKL